MTTTQAHEAPRAIVWVDARHAIIATTGPGGELTSEIVDRGQESEQEFLAHVVRELGDRATVGIVGPSGARLALEREYVAINHRPERLVGIPGPLRAAGAEVLQRMRRLAA